MALPPYVTPYSGLNISQVLLLYLGREGVTKVFGIPGGGVAELLVEFMKQRQAFEYVVCRHETGAAYIADGYYRATGTLGRGDGDVGAWGDQRSHRRHDRAK